MKEVCKELSWFVSGITAYLSFAPAAKPDCLESFVFTPLPRNLHQIGVSTPPFS